MTTARSLITSALRRMGAIGDNEAPTATEANQGLESLNEMLDTWSTENLTIVANTETVFRLATLQGSYTIGTGGDIDVVWPFELEHAQLRVLTTNPPLDLPLRLLSQQEWVQIRLKGTESTYPQHLWLHTTFPLGTLHLWPVPTESNDLILWHNTILGAFATLDTDVQFARGYARALRYNLTEELAPEYGRETSAMMQRQAETAKALLKRANIKKRLAAVDVPVSYDYGTYNWRTDEPGSGVPR